MEDYSIAEKSRRDRRVVVKRRNFTANARLLWFDLVECANLFYSERKSNTAVSGLVSRHRQTGIVPVRLGP
jgi:hypothetical protein